MADKNGPGILNLNPGSWFALEDTGSMTWPSSTCRNLCVSHSLCFSAGAVRPLGLFWSCFGKTMEIQEIQNLPTYTVVKVDDDCHSRRWWFVYDKSRLVGAIPPSTFQVVYKQWQVSEEATLLTTCWMGWSCKYLPMLFQFGSVDRVYSQQHRARMEQSLAHFVSCICYHALQGAFGWIFAWSVDVSVAKLTSVSRGKSANWRSIQFQVSWLNILTSYYILFDIYIHIIIYNNHMFLRVFVYTFWDP